jgi:hypothetical protein
MKTKTVSIPRCSKIVIKNKKTCMQQTNSQTIQSSQGAVTTHHAANGQAIQSAHLVPLFPIPIQSQLVSHVPPTPLTPNYLLHNYNAEMRQTMPINYSCVYASNQHVVPSTWTRADQPAVMDHINKNADDQTTGDAFT